MQDTLNLLYENGYDEESIEGMVIFNDMCNAIIGVTDDYRLVYDYDEMIRALAERDDMTESEAAEYVDYNIVGFKINNPRSPIIMYRLDAKDDASIDIVRCVDCIHRNYSKKYDLSWCKGNLLPDLDFFCRDGKRK